MSLRYAWCVFLICIVSISMPVKILFIALRVGVLYLEVKNKDLSLVFNIGQFFWVIFLQKRCNVSCFRSEVLITRFYTIVSL